MSHCLIIHHEVLISGTFTLVDKWQLDFACQYNLDVHLESGKFNSYSNRCAGFDETQLSVGTCYNVLEDDYYSTMYVIPAKDLCEICGKPLECILIDEGYNPEIQAKAICPDDTRLLPSKPDDYFKHRFIVTYF